MSYVKADIYMYYPICTISFRSSSCCFQMIFSFLLTVKVQFARGTWTPCIEWKWFDSVHKLRKMSCMDVSPHGGIIVCGYENGVFRLFSLQTKVLRYTTPGPLKITPFSACAIVKRTMCCSSFTRSAMAYMFTISKRTIIFGEVIRCICVLFMPFLFKGEIMKYIIHARVDLFHIRVKLIHCDGRKRFEIIQFLCKI